MRDQLVKRKQMQRLFKRLALLPLLHLLLLPISSALAESRMYYVGLAETGWQIFERNLESQEESQLTDSLGDKRFPTWVETLQKVIYKDAQGQICAIGETGEKVIVPGVRTCAHFAVTQDGHQIYYTRLLANNPLRQSLWRATRQGTTDTYGDIELLYRMPRGSIRNVCLSPDDQIITFTHVWRDNEERIHSLSLKTLEKSSESQESTPSIPAITPELATCAFPRYSADGESIYYVKRVERGNYDILHYQKDTNQSSVLIGTKDQSEFSPFLTEKKMYFEVRKGMNSHISELDLASGEVDKLDITRPAKEPWVVVK